MKGVNIGMDVKSNVNPFLLQNIRIRSIVPANAPTDSHDGAQCMFGCNKLLSALVRPQT